MPIAAAHLRQQIEAALAHRIPSALTPAPRVIRPTAPTGIPALDEALTGGLPIGALTELTGPECSGRTSLALSFVARLTQDNRVCAWVDVSDTLHPESAAAAGVDLNRLLWIRCGPEPEQLPLSGMSDNASGENPRAASRSPVPVPNSKLQTLNSVSQRPVSAPPIRHDYLAPRCCEPMPKVRPQSRELISSPEPANSKLQTLNSAPLQPVTCNRSPASRPRKPYSRLDQALRATDLLLQGGGFSAIVLDMGSVAPEFALRVPLATWFRYRAAAERTHASLLLLTQHTCSKSSAGLVLHCLPGPIDSDSITVLTGAEHRVEIARDRFARVDNVVDFTRKPPQPDHRILWRSRTPWAASCPSIPPKAGRP